MMATEIDEANDVGFYQGKACSASGSMTRQQQQAEVIIEDEVEADVDVESEFLGFELELNANESLRVPADFTHDYLAICEAVKRMDNTKLHS